MIAGSDRPNTRLCVDGYRLESAALPPLAEFNLYRPALERIKCCSIDHLVQLIDPLVSVDQAPYSRTLALLTPLAVTRPNDARSLHSSSTCEQQCRSQAHHESHQDRYLPSRVNDSPCRSQSRRARIRVHMLRKHRLIHRKWSERQTRSMSVLLEVDLLD